MKLINKIKIIILLFVLAVTLNTYSLVGQVAISTNLTEADASAILEIESTTKGLLIPRVTDAQRNILSATATNGLLVFSTDQNRYFYYNGTTWLELETTSTNNDWVINGNDMYMARSGNVGIGVSSPSQQLEISRSIDMPRTTNSTTGVIYKGSDPFLYSYKPASARPDYHTLFLGKDNGNFDMAALTDHRATRMIGIGSGVLPNVDSASGCIGIGYQCLNSQESSYLNNVFGAFALNSSVKYYHNLVFGYKAALADTGKRSTIFGSKAMINTNGGGTSKAISIGYNSASNSISGGINTSIGNNTQFAHTNYSGQLNIGNLIYGVGMGTGTEQFSTYMIHIGGMPYSGFGMENFNINGDMRIGGTAAGDYLDMSMNPGAGKISLSDFGSGAHSFKITMPNNAADTISFGGWYWDGSNKLYENEWNLISNGNFGVLTLSPDYKLQVNGSIAPETNGQDLGTSSLKWDAYLRDVNAQDVNISEVIILSPQLSTYAPLNPAEGEIYVDHNHNIKCYLNGVWKTLNN